MIPYDAAQSDGAEYCKGCGYDDGASEERGVVKEGAPEPGYCDEKKEPEDGGGDDEDGGGCCKPDASLWDRRFLGHGGVDVGLLYRICSQSCCPDGRQGDEVPSVGRAGRCAVRCTI